MKEHRTWLALKGASPRTPVTRRSQDTKGFYGRRKNTIRTAKAAVDKAGQYAYRDRRVKKRNFRALWIQRINAAARPGLTYGRFIHGLDKAGSRSTARSCPSSPSPTGRFKAIADKA